MKTFAAILVVLMVGALTAQQPQAEFEVASVRRNVAGAPGRGPTAVERFTPDGVSYRNFTVVMLIKAAYRILQDERLIGGPDWARTHRYDVTAKAPTEVSRDDVRMMMRRVLQDRFKLLLVTEKRERDAYALRLDRTDGRLGPDLRRAADDCETRKKRDHLTFTREMLAMRTSTGLTASALAACETIQSIVDAFERSLKTSVIDETKLTGNWDWVIAYSRIDARSGSLAAEQAEGRPSVFVAVKEQLGLKLERMRKPGVYEVFRIKSVDPATDN